MSKKINPDDIIVSKAKQKWQRFKTQDLDSRLKVINDFRNEASSDPELNPLNVELELSNAKSLIDGIRVHKSTIETLEDLHNDIDRHYRRMAASNTDLADRLTKLTEEVYSYRLIAESNASITKEIKYAPDDKPALSLQECMAQVLPEVRSENDAKAFLINVGVRMTKDSSNGELGFVDEDLDDAYSVFYEDLQVVSSSSRVWVYYHPEIGFFAGREVLDVDDIRKKYPDSNVIGIIG